MDEEDEIEEQVERGYPHGTPRRIGRKFARCAFSYCAWWSPVVVSALVAFADGGLVRGGLGHLGADAFENG